MIMTGTEIDYVACRRRYLNSLAAPTGTATSEEIDAAVREMNRMGVPATGPAIKAQVRKNREASKAALHAEMDRHHDEMCSRCGGSEYECNVMQQNQEINGCPAFGCCPECTHGHCGECGRTTGIGELERNNGMCTNCSSFRKRRADASNH
jgi:hypothetical protein